jgi:hypothetical protein
MHEDAEILVSVISRIVTLYPMKRTSDYSRTSIDIHPDHCVERGVAKGENEIIKQL